MKIMKTMEEVKSTVLSTLGDQNKAYFIKIENHDEARLLLESVRAFEKMGISNVPDSSTLKKAIKQIEKKIMLNSVSENKNKLKVNGTMPEYCESCE
jgi:hypothetical protein